MKPRPNFLVLGAAKSGSTSLCSLLASHPDVLMSKPKEPIFFELEYGRGLDFYAHKYFRHWNGQAAVGEGRVYNLFLPYVPERIRESLPEVRLIAILREPVARAHSHWWHQFTAGYDRRSFEEAVEQELEALERNEEFTPKLDEASWRKNLFMGATGIPQTPGIKSAPYMEMGYYNVQLSRYFSRFPRDRIRVLLLDDLRRQRDRVVRDLWQFLGVDADRDLPDRPPDNVARGEVKGSLTFVAERLGWATGMHRVIPKHVRTAIRRRLPSRAAERPAIRPDLERELRRHFAESNRDLAQALGRPGLWAGGVPE